MVVVTDLVNVDVANRGNARNHSSKLLEEGSVEISVVHDGNHVVFVVAVVIHLIEIIPPN